MYFSVDTVKRQRGSDILTVTNFLGWEVIKVTLSTNIEPHDGCTIIRDENDIAKISSWAAPIWHVEHLDKGSKFTSSELCTDEQAQIQCGFATATVAYSAFLPNWKISPSETEITKGDLPITTGFEELDAGVVCAPEFPLAAIPLLVGLSVTIFLVRTRFQRLVGW